MRAIVMTSCFDRNSSPDCGLFDPTKSLVDRPVVQHVVELLATRGISDFEFVLGDEAPEIEATLGNGSRWGVAIRHHLIHDNARPYALLRNIAEAYPDENFLLVHADHLVECDHQAGADSAPKLFLKDMLRLVSLQNWTGWAVARGDDLLMAADAQDRTDLISRWATRCRGWASHDWLPLRDDRETVAAQEAMLGGRFRDLIRSGREVEPGIWLARNVSLHQSAVLVAPVHIAEDCWIGPGVHIGPNVSIGSGSVLDEGTRIADAMVMPRTYAGRGLDLFGVVVDRDRARFIASGTVLDPNDFTMLSEVGGSPFREQIGGLFDRAVAVVSLLVLFPLVAIWILLSRCRGKRQRPTFRDVVCIPASRDEKRWQTFRLWSFAESNQGEVPSFHDLCSRIWPGLFAVATGQIRLVGQPMRAIEQLREMVRDRLDWSRTTRAGLITERLVRLDPDATLEERNMADACHAATVGFRHDCGLFLGYFIRLMSRTQNS